MLNAEQNEALSVIRAGHNLYIGGQAGTGKTYLLQKVVNVLRNDGKSVSITCTTGIACTNYPISFGAMTIHR